MNKEDMFNAVSNINSDILDDVDEYADSGKVKKYVWWRAGAIAVACVIIALLLMLPGIKGNSQFTVTAYAMGEDGELVGIPFKAGETINMTEVKLSSGKSCFLFSVDLKDKKSKSQVRFFADYGIDDSIHEEIMQLFNEKTGKAYFGYAPNVLNDGRSILNPFNYIDTDGAEGMFYLYIASNDEGYIARLITSDEEIEIEKVMPQTLY